MGCERCHGCGITESNPGAGECGYCDYCLDVYCEMCCDQLGQCKGCDKYCCGNCGNEAYGVFHCDNCDPREIKLSQKRAALGQDQIVLIGEDINTLKSIIASLKSAEAREVVNAFLEDYEEYVQQKAKKVRVD